MINLEKKKPISLTKAAPGLNHVKVGLSWDPSSDVEVDADASLFMLDESGKIPSEDFFVFFNNLTSGDGSIIHSGDNRTGDGDGDDEEININLHKVSGLVVQIIVVISIHNKEDGVHFGNVLNPAVRVYDQSNGSIICQYELAEKFDGFSHKNQFSKNEKELLMGRLALVNLFSSKMSAADFTFMAATFSSPNIKNYVKYIMPMSSTPLNEAIIASMKMVPKFKEDNNLQIVNTV
mgnify:CR=1 FL=1